MLCYTKIIICYIICHTHGIAKKENDVVQKKKRIVMQQQSNRM